MADADPCIGSRRGASPDPGGVRKVAMRGAFALAVTGLALGACVADAQTWRTLDVAAGADGAPLSVRVEYTRGQLQARRADRPGTLYDLHLRYDASRTRPLLSWDTTTRSL